MQLLGTIIGYAGRLDRLPPEWLPCDGRPIARDGQYKPLWKVVGDTFGSGDQYSTFNLPDLRNMFIRGVDDTPNTEVVPAVSGRDPDAASRVPLPPSNLNSGNLPVTMQEQQVRSHAHAITGSIQLDNNDGGGRVYNPDAGGPPYWQTQASGNPLATVPKSLLVYFIMLVIDSEGGSPQLPIGACINYWSLALPQLDTGEELWLCDGAEQMRTDGGKTTPLYAVIGGAFGTGDGVMTYNVPDLRGRFVRGVDSSPALGSAGRDPDIAGRYAMARGGGSKGDVGSCQADQFARHCHQLAGITACAPVSMGDVTARGTQAGGWAWDTPTCAAGGSETRPQNAALAFLLVGAGAALSSPVGSIVPYGGSADPQGPAGTTWRICDGRTLADGTTLPDLRGRFLWGLPDYNGFAGSASEDYLQDHVHSIQGDNYDVGASGGDVLAAGCPPDGGDMRPAGPTEYTGGAETRPVNAYMHYIIRVA